MPTGVELLDDQADNKILCVVFLRHNKKDGAFPRTEFLCVNGCIKAQYLLQLGIQKSIESGESCGENTLHSLLRRVECRSSKPLCFMRIRQMHLRSMQIQAKLTTLAVNLKRIAKIASSLNQSILLIFPKYWGLTLLTLKSA